MDKSVRDDQEFVSKVILIGDSGVGKSSILLRYTQEVFYMNHVKTVGRIICIKKKRRKIKSVNELEILFSVSQQGSY